MTLLRSANPLVRLLLAALGLIVPILLSQQIPASVSYQVGEVDTLPNIDGLYPPESGPNGSFRWTHDLVSTGLQPLGYPLFVTYHLQGTRPEGADPAQVSATTNNRNLGLYTLSQEPVDLTYRLPLDTLARINSNITLVSNTFQPSGDSRNLGVVLYSIEVQNAPGPWPSVPVIWVALSYLFGGLFVYLIGAVGLQNRVLGLSAIFAWGCFIGLLNALIRPWLIFYCWYLVVPPLAFLAFLLVRRDLLVFRAERARIQATGIVAANAELRIGAARAIAAVVVVATLLILAWHKLAPNEVPVYDPHLNTTWGVSAFSRLPLNYQIAGILAVLGAIAWAFLAPAGNKAGKASIFDPDTWPNSLWRWLPLVLAVVGIALFIVFPVSYSDGDSGMWNHIQPRNRLWESELLDTYLKSRVFRTFYPAIPAFWNAFEVVAVFAGVIYIAGAWALASALGRNRKEMLILLFGLFSIGNIIFFFRYVEVYALMTAAGVWLIWACWRYVEGKLAFMALAALYIIAILCHGAMLWETPMVVAAFFLGPSYLPFRERARQYVRKFSYGSLLGIASFSVVAAVIILDGYTLATLLSTNPGVGGGDRRMFVSLSISGDSSFEYFTLFSWNHLAAIIQEQLQTAPVALLTLITILLLSGKDVLKIAQLEPAVIALAVGVASTLLFAALWNPDLGPRNDWDLFALPAVPLTILALYLLLKLPPGKPRRLAIAAYLSLSFVHALGWLLTHILHIGF